MQQQDFEISLFLLQLLPLLLLPLVGNKSPSLKGASSRRLSAALLWALLHLVPALLEKVLWLLRLLLLLLLVLVPMLPVEYQRGLLRQQEDQL
jgi:lysylphosphatidylglycerol synthetase-like protein (DUF2156 family)